MSTNFTLLLVVALAGSFGYLAFRNFRLAFALLIALLPSYLVRFEVWRLPSTALEVLFGVFFLTWLIKYSRSDFPKLKSFLVRHRAFSVLFVIFALASFVSIFVSDMVWYSFGQWRAYFLEPFILFIVLVGRQKSFDSGLYIDAFSWSSLGVSFLAVAQKISGLGLDDFGRSLSFFTSPNAVGLYLAPLVVILGCGLWDQFTNKRWGLKILRHKEFWLFTLSFFAIIFTRSLGTLLGLAVAVPIILFIFGKRREALAYTIALIGAVLLVFKTTGLSWQKSQSLNNRFVLWNYTYDFLSDSPKNFVLGTGIRQYFRKVQKPHYEPKELERLIYPHNIFLNFWTETGLVGALAFFGILTELYIFSKKLFHKKHLLAAAMSAGVLTVILIHGLIDVPYFKNDLAMMFWAFSAFILQNTEEV